MSGLPSPVVRSVQVSKLTRFEILSSFLIQPSFWTFFSSIKLYSNFRLLSSCGLQKYIFRVLNGVREKKSLAKIFCLCGIQNIWKEVWKGWLHLATLSSKNCILSTFANISFDLNYLYIPSSLKSLESLKDGTIQDHIKENHSSKLYISALFWHSKILTSVYQVT